jgi:hypothetical protein
MIEKKKVLQMSDLPTREKEEKKYVKPTMIKMSDIPDANSRRKKEKVYIANRKIGDVLKDGAWKGERCFIIAGGESVKDFDVSKLAGEHVIGVNLAFRLVDPEIIYGMDARLWGWIDRNETGEGDKAKFDASRAIKIFSDISGAPLPEDIVTAPSIGRPGLSHKFSEGIGAGTNSGFGALNIALILGASEIYLIGYDFYGERWHKGYPQQGEAGNDFHKQCYDENSVAFKEFPSKIINLNPKSKLKIFEFGTMPTDLKPAPELIKSVDVPLSPRPREVNEPIFVNYYTPDNGYKQYADNLRKTLDRLQLDYDVQAIRNRGDWDKNTKVKPEFLLQMMDKYPGRPIVWLDADSVVLSLPEKLLKCQADFACRIRDTGELISSVMLFKNNELSRQFLKEIQKLISEGDVRSFGEQKFIQEIFDKWQKENRFVFENLPETYCCIMGISDMKEEPVIEQHQASRKLKT